MEGFEGINVIKTEKNLYLQNIDSILIEALQKKEHEEQRSSLMTILKTPKPLNEIEILSQIFIPPKEKIPLDIQIIDDILIEEKKSQKM